METNIRNPRDLFQPGIRYIVPTFQRQYIWSKGDQWEPLWEDLRGVAEKYLEALERSNGESVEAQEQTTPHFLGAIVLQQVRTATSEIERRVVIDGQQRLTTLQLLLDAVQFVVEDLGFEGSADRLSMLVLNDKRLIGQNESHIFKLWPTRTDREAFRHAMDNGLPVDDFEGSRIVRAHEFFQREVRHWLGEAKDARVGRVEALETAITVMLNLVVIDLGQQDDPNVIFETLNARGTPLEQSALIKNFALSRRPLDEEWQKVWNNLEDAWWLREVSQGRLWRPRLDMLINYWLSMRTGEEVPPSRVFTTFRTLEGTQDIDCLMRELNRDLSNYRRFEHGERTTYENLFYYRAGVMRVGVITPVLLKLLDAEVSVREGALRALESYLVRRMICRMTTRDYSRFMLDLAVRLRDRGLEQADKVVAEFLKDQVAYSREWPRDRTVADTLAWSPLYPRLTRGRLRLVIEGIESVVRTDRAETGDVPRNLTIEHLMPVSWKEDKWPLPAGLDKEEATESRNGLIHTIGNLTLLTQKLNSELSNAPWQKKRPAIQKYSVLSMNSELVTRDCWDEDSIRDRNKRMAELIAKCWPGPDSEVWGV